MGDIQGASFGPGSREPSPAVSAASGFDPSRGDDACYLEACRDLVAGDWRPNKNIYLDLLCTAERLLARVTAAIRVIEYGYSGQPTGYEECPHGKFGFEDCLACYDDALLAALCDSAGSGEAGETRSGSTVGDSAGLEEASPYPQSPEGHSS